jgi:energy-coupling factor transport system ATP-binding protein
VNPALRFTDVTFTYPDTAVAALDRVSLAIPEGTFALITGATGAGKSTLLRAMNGLVPHFTGGEWSGNVLVEGRDTLEHAPRKLADVVSYVPQDPAASFVVDVVEDELAYAMENLGAQRAVMRRRVEETLDLLDIEHLRDRSVRSLSGGERQRVAIAAALTAGARVLLLDEPTSQLDPQGAEDVLAALQRLVHDHGLTVVIAEHRLDRVTGFVDLALGCVLGRVEVGEVRTILEWAATGPPVHRLGRALGWSPLPLTVREARRSAAASGIVLNDDGRTAELRPGDVVLSTNHPLSASYGARVALERIALDLRAGEIVALMGRNGAGKTTLLRCLCGLHEPDSGGVNAPGGEPEPGRNVALCPQMPDSVLFKETVTQEVQVTLDARRINPSGASSAPSVRTAKDVLRELGILDLASAHPRDLSAGQRLLVAVAAIAATRAPVLLLDEPTRGLDPESKSRLSTMLRAYVRDGRVVVFATHDVELVAALADRVLMLAGGRVIADGSPEDVIGDSAVFAPQTARVFGPRWLTPERVAEAMSS